MKPTAKAVAAMAVQRAKGDTILYSSEDCKTFVEQCVRKCGGSMSIAGSNDLVRNHCAWLGTVSSWRVVIDVARRKCKTACSLSG